MKRWLEVTVWAVMAVSELFQIPHSGHWLSAFEGAGIFASALLIRHAIQGSGQ